MKIMCDVCKREEAVIFCCADEAALCGTCDDHVHLADNHHHRRLSLLQSLSTPQLTLCDACQDKGALFFCREDRALFCSDCDTSIHGVNDLTKKHSRFLFSGTSLSFADAPAKQEADKLSVSDYFIDELELLEDFLHEHPSKTEEEEPIWFPEEDVDDGSLFSAIRVLPQEKNQRRRRRQPYDDGFTVPELAGGDCRSCRKRNQESASSLMPDGGGSPLFPSLFFV